SLPIHAAGYHDRGSTRNVLDRVVSSYAPTLRSLAYSRERARIITQPASTETLIVDMSETPGEFRELHYARQEVKDVHDVLSQAMPTHVLRSPTKLQVISK